MDGKTDTDGTDKEDLDSSFSRPRRDGSPAVSIASAALEWDPSADVGVPRGSSDEVEVKSQRGARASPSLQRLTDEAGVGGYTLKRDVGVGGAPSYELLEEDRTPPSGPSGIIVRGCAFSTPTGITPAPLGSLQYSPVMLPESQGTPADEENQKNRDWENQENRNRENQGNMNFGGENRNVGQENRNGRNVEDNQGVAEDGGRKPETSDEDNNDDHTTRGPTPGREVSEASTDWEYDYDKENLEPRKHKWQTSGLTKSEIEYETKKKNGSSSSIGSSVLLLQIETKFSESDRGSGNGNRKKENNASPDSSPDDDTEKSRELNRKLEKILKRKQLFQNTREHEQSSDPSTMCGLIKEYVKLLDKEPAKENIQYDVLKKHRDYHLMKVWQQISTLEKLNMQLLKMKGGGHYLKRSQAHHSKRTGTQENIFAEPKPARSSKKEAVKPETVSKKGLANLVDYGSDDSSEVEYGDRGPFATGSVNPYLPKKKNTIYKSIPTVALDKGNGGGETRYTARTFPRGSEEQSEWGPFAIGSQNPYLRKQKLTIFQSYPTATTNGEGSDVSEARESVHSRSSKGGRNADDERSGRKKKSSKVDKGVGTKEAEKPVEKKPPIGFFVPFTSDDDSNCMPDTGGGGDAPCRPPQKRQVKQKVDPPKTESGLYDVKGQMNIQDCLRKNKPDCYQSIKDRDDFILHRKADRQIRDETLIRDILECDIPLEEVDEYVATYLTYYTEQQAQRAKQYLAEHDNGQSFEDQRRVISNKEMRERTARLLQHDTMEKQRKEAQERKKQYIRNLQKMYSKNLRRYQQMGGVNIPDLMKLGRFKQ